MKSAAGNRTRGDWVKTRHVTYYTTAEKQEEGENRTREPEGLGPEPSAFDRFATSPQRKETLARAALPLPNLTQPLGRIELPTCSLRVNRSATELKRRCKQEIRFLDFHPNKRELKVGIEPTTYRLTVCRTTDCATQAFKKRE